MYNFDADIVGETFCINTKELYNSLNCLKYGHIVPDFEDGEMVYYDLYNDDGCLACMHGEECIVDAVEDNVIVFRNTQGEHDVQFKLTFQEADIVIFQD